MAALRDWILEGRHGLPIIGTTHASVADRPRGSVIIAHGFKGYKDYGFLPVLASALAQRGFIAHRFNFAHSGMDHGHGDFDPERFRADTWNHQVGDLLTVLEAVTSGELGGDPGTVSILGHSRGGNAAILMAGRYAGDSRLESLRGVITAGTPAATNRLTPAEESQLRRDGVLPSPSARTGQTLEVGAAWLREQQADPEGHDLATQAGRLRVPLGIIHGIEDDAVSPDEASLIAEAAGERAMMRLIPGANHVFNTPNPADPTADPSPPLKAGQDIVVDWLGRWLH